MPDEILLEIRHQCRQLRRQRRAAHGHQPISDVAHQRIGGDARQTVGATALETDDQLTGGDTAPNVLGGVVDEQTQQYSAGLQFVRDGLTLQKRRALRVPVTQQLFQLSDAAVFAAPSQHQHASGVGMPNQIAEGLTGMLLIVPCLGAAVGMGPSVNTGDTAPYVVGNLTGQRLGYTVDAAHGWG